MKYISVIFLMTLITLLNTGCGTVNTDTALDKTNRTMQIKTYITKGNYLQIARYAYQTVIDPMHTDEEFWVNLPGKSPQNSFYAIDTITSSNQQKIILQNHKERLEIKLLGDTVHVMLIGNNFTLEQKLSRTDFLAV